jgi:hypothetical protein
VHLNRNGRRERIVHTGVRRARPRRRKDARWRYAVECNAVERVAFYRVKEERRLLKWTTNVRDQRPSRDKDMSDARAIGRERVRVLRVFVERRPAGSHGISERCP